MNRQKAVHLLKRYWPILAIFLIMLLGFYVRTLDYRWPYLRNIDSYNFYREIENILNNNGVIPGYDPLLLPPGGSGIPGTFGRFQPYQYLAVYSYMFFKSFSPETTLTQFLIWFPPLLAILMAIPTYFIGKFLYDRKAGILAAFFVVFDMSVISRTLAGDPDSDAIVLLMPLIVIALFLFTYKYTEKTSSIFNRRLLLYSAITGISLGIWGLTWAGQWFVAWLLVGFFTVKISIETIKKRNIKQVFTALKIPIYSLLLILTIYILINVSIQGPDFIRGSIQGPFVFGDIKGEEARDFPNVYVSVAELQSPSDIKQIIQRVSAINFDTTPAAIFISPFTLMIFALFYLGYSYLKTRKHMDTLILMLIWFLGPFFATIIATRFSIMFSAPMSICSAIVLSKLIRMSTGADKKLED